MEQLPSPSLPTEQEVIAENQCIRGMIFVTPPLLLLSFILVGVLTAICIACNFNPMNWLE